MERNLRLARLYVESWIGDAQEREAIVAAVAPHVVGLWDIVTRAEETMCWWGEQAAALGWSSGQVGRS